MMKELISSSLNKEQKEIVDSKFPYVLVSAGPGTGKTHTLVKAVQEYRRKNPDKPINVITFTNKAANELHSRLQGENVSFIGTIHSFAISVLTVAQYDYGFTIRLLTRQEILMIANSIQKHDKYITGSDLVRFIYKEINVSKLPQRLRMGYYKAFKKYQEKKAKLNAYDFTDSPEYLVQKIKDHNMQIDVGSLFVDEGQDLNKAQYEMIRSLIAEKKMVIGDIKQSIYQFRGAHADVFNKFKLDGFKEYKLKKNYRSKKEILNYVGANDLEATRGYGGKVYHNFDIMKHNPMVLCRTNVEVSKIKKYYPDASTIHAAKGLEYHAVVVLDFNQKDEEDENVMYVAMTRAEDYLMVTEMNSIMSYLKKGRLII